MMAYTLNVDLKGYELVIVTYKSEYEKILTSLNHTLKNSGFKCTYREDCIQFKVKLEDLSGLLKSKINCVLLPHGVTLKEVFKPDKFRKYLSLHISKLLLLGKIEDVIQILNNLLKIETLGNKRVNCFFNSIPLTKNRSIRSITYHLNKYLSSK